MRHILPIFLILVIGCKGKGAKDPEVVLPDGISPSECIERVFEQDSILGNVRNHASEQISLSEGIMNYAGDLEKLDYDNCPEKFVSAFGEHIKAWKNVTKITDEYPSLRGELHDIFSELEKSKDSVEFKLLVKQVWDTWAEVEEHAKYVTDESL